MSKEKYWSKFSDSFDEKVTYVTGEQIIDEIKETLNQLSLSGNILEVGCGTGMYSKTIAKYSNHLTSCDYSEEMISTAKTNLSTFPNVTVTQDNCMNLSFSDNLFDSVILINLLHIIEDPYKTIEEAKRVLKPQGRIIVISITTSGMSFFNKLGMIYRYLKAYGKPSSSARMLTLSSANKIINIEGLKIKRSMLIGKNSKAVVMVAEKITAKEVYINN